jgi:predicted TIM-barrel fold metal-dependent hydrolase
MSADSSARADAGTARPSAGSTSESKSPSAANRLGLDYAAEAVRLGSPPAPIIDVHSHIGGAKAAAIFKRAADLYGVERIYSMTHIEQLPAMRDIFGERMRFIAVPDYRAEDKRHSLGRGYIERIEKYAAAGVKIAKFWAAPRATDYAIEMGDPTFMKLDHPVRIEAMEAARGHGMIFMTHIADPDTWFKTRYRDASVYGTKRQQYEPFENLLDRFTQPWIAAHLGGWPEDLDFLTDLLERHENLYLDTSATKWMVRELSRHSRDEVIDFLMRFRGRIMFGSDVVTADEHLEPQDGDAANEMLRKASSPEEAFNLYASRYWALRTLWETDYDGESPIADPDLAMVEPDRFTEFDAPPLRGRSLPHDLLRTLYHDAAAALLDPLHDAPTATGDSRHVEAEIDR